MGNTPCKRVIVLGMDGLDPGIMEPLMDSGRANHFAALRESGAYRRLATSNPAESPVAWSCIATGANPGVHGVFDFIRRNPKKYLPELALLQVNPKNLLGRPDQMFLKVRHGTAFWEATTRAGLPTSVIRWPVTLPVEPVNGRMFAGLGVPDLKANLGRYAFYTTRKFTDAEREALKGDVVDVPAGKDMANAKIAGPEGARIPMRIQLDREKKKVTLRIAGKRVEIEQGAWSDWTPLRFTVRLVKSAQGIVRFYLKSVEPELELYQTPVQPDPREPVFPFTHPNEYAAELAKEQGLYATLGMPEDTSALGDGSIDTAGFCTFCEDIMNEREAMFWRELDRLETGTLGFVFDTTDRVQHAFWRTLDEEHPAFDADYRERYGKVIEGYYLRMNEILGKVLERIDDQTGLIIISDHGFATFRKAVHINSWLVENGYMTLKSGSSRDAVLYRNVDWSKTKAYALGFSSIFLNLKGREGSGIVSPGEEAEALKRELVENLSPLKDTETGQPVIKQVYRREELYKGPHVDDAPDVIVGMQKGYRFSWQTALGGAPEGLIEENRESWSGDHLMDPSFVPGVFFMNRTCAIDAPHLIDIAPTALAMFGLDAAPDMEGRSLLGE